MQKNTYKRIDAFTSGGSSGNPAGVVYLDKQEELSVEQMQAIARHEKGIVSEVVFCRPIEEGLYSLKYYSSECQVEFCGHGTIACMYDLINNDPTLKQQETITIRTMKGDLPVFNDINKSDAVFITAPAPEYHPCHLAIQDIAENLGVNTDGLDQTFDVAIINGGLTTLIVPLKSLDIIINLEPEYSKLEKYCINSNVDIVLVFSSEAFTQTHWYRTRVFAPKYGYLEDPATGSGNSAFGYYLLQRNLWDGNDLISVEQGPSREMPNVVKLGTKVYDGGQRIIFGGKASAR